MRYEVNLRDGSQFEVEASYVEIADSPTSTSFLLLGALPGYPTAILAIVPADAAKSVLPAAMIPMLRRTDRDPAMA